MSASGYMRLITFADVLAWVGNVPNYRVRCNPPAGLCTREDLDCLNMESETRHELIASVIVERASSPSNSRVRDHIAHIIALTLGDTAARIVINHPFQLDRYLVRLPDIALLDAPESRVPVLVIEVLHPDNTVKEMAMKLAECKRYGVKLVWYIDPERKEVDVYPKGNPKRKKTLGVNDTLDGGDVLSGFAVKVAKLFESRAPIKKGGKKPKK